MSKQTKYYSTQSSPFWKPIQNVQLLHSPKTQQNSLNSNFNSTNNNNSCFIFKGQTKISPQKQIYEMNTPLEVSEKATKRKIKPIMIKYSTPPADRDYRSSLLVSQSTQSSSLSPQQSKMLLSLNQDNHRSFVLNEPPSPETNKHQSFQSPKNGSLGNSCDLNKNFTLESQFSPFSKGIKGNKKNITLSALFENDKSQNQVVNTRRDYSQSRQQFSSFIMDSSSLADSIDLNNQFLSTQKPILDQQHTPSACSPHNQSLIFSKPLNHNFYLCEIGLFGSGKFRITQQTSERNAMKNQITVNPKHKQSSSLKPRQISNFYLPKENNKQEVNEVLFHKDVFSKQFVVDYLNSSLKSASPNQTNSIDIADNTSEKQDYVEDISFFLNTSQEKKISSQVLINSQIQLRRESRNENKSINGMPSSKNTSNNCMDNNRYLKQQFLSSFKGRSTFKVGSKFNLIPSAQDILSQQIELAQNLPFGDVIDKKKLSHQANKTIKVTHSPASEDERTKSQNFQSKQQNEEHNLLRLMSPSNSNSNKSRASRRSIGPNTMGQDSKLFRQFVSQNQRKKLIPQQVRLALKKAIYYLRSVDVAPKDLLTIKVFSSEPFEKPFSYDLIQAAKFGNVLKVKECLNENKYLVFDFDYIYLTALHWAAKRNHLQIVEILLKKGSDVNSKDIVLLEKKASPWSTPQLDYVAAAKENVRILTQLNKFKKINIIVSMSPFSKREQIWEKQIQLFHY